MRHFVDRTTEVRVHVFPIFQTTYQNMMVLPSTILWKDGFSNNWVNKDGV